MASAMPSESAAHAALQFAEKVDFALDFGWRSALALR
jgi:hypothetical protein